jgi:hypothetical protein
MEAEISTEHQIVRKEVALALDYAVTHYQESRHCSEWIPRHLRQNFVLKGVNKESIINLRR